jgi:outer membrane scaffolding protein for murein synthesis (MipA/OmpV family)
LLRWYKAAMRLLALLLLLPAAVAAQVVVPDEEILLGAGVRTRPAYDGSGDQTTDLIPLIRYYGRPWFVQLAYEEGRETSESGLLQRLGVDDLDPGVSLGVHAEWDTKIGPAPVSLLGRWRQHLDTDRGAQADLRFNVGVYGGHGAIVALYAQTTWASSKSMRSFYLVDGSGLLHTTLGALGSYDLSPRWLLFGGASWRRLHGDVTRSVLVEEKTSFYANAGVAYRF